MIFRRVFPISVVLFFCAFSFTQEARGLGFEVTYADGATEGFFDQTLGEARRTAFEYALSIWASAIPSEATLTVEARFDPLGGTPFGAVLAQAGPRYFVTESDPEAQNLPLLPSTVYTGSQASALAGQSLSGGDFFEFSVTCNTSVDGDFVLGESKWYYGLDALPPPQDFDFVTTVLHEIGHGLGFLDLIDEFDGTWIFDIPDIYSRQLIQPGVGNVDTMSNAQRRVAAISGNLFWKGPRVVAAKDSLVKMYAPNPFRGGSSVAHWDTSNFPNLLMEPFDTGPKHDVDITIEAFLDLGYPSTEVVPTFTPTSRFSPTPTFTPTRTPTPSNTPTPTFTPSHTRTPTNTFTPTNTPTATPTFTPRVTHAQEVVSVIGINPVSVVAADLDGVNFDDIVTANRGGDDLSVALNDGSGSFSSGVLSIPLEEGDSPSFVTSGDLNNDGAADILAIAAGTNRLVAFLQTDGKGLEEGVSIGPKVYVRRDFPNLDVSKPISAFIGDLDGDGFMDLAVANSSGNDLTLAFGTPNPEGLFVSTGERISSGGAMPVFVTGGVLRPGSPGLELVTTNWKDSTVSVIALDREIEGDLVADIDVYPVGVNPRHALIADLDLDGDNDIAVTGQGAPQLNFPIEGTITLLYNISGTGQFVIPSDGGTLTPGGALLSAAAFDYDNNGFLDLAVSQRSRGGAEGKLLIYYNDPEFVDVPGIRNFDPFAGPGELPLAVASAALNSGLPPNENVALKDDLVITDQASNAVGVVTITGSSVKGRASADLNLDRSTDSSDLFLFALLGAQKDSLIRKTGDLTGEGQLNSADLIRFLQLRRQPMPIQPQYSGLSALPKGIAPLDTGYGDANGDGVVDAADFYAIFD